MYFYQYTVLAVYCIPSCPNELQNHATRWSSLGGRWRACRGSLQPFLGTWGTCREQFGIPLLLKQLEGTPFDGLTVAAADAVRAVAMNNDANKNAVRENWGIPLLAKMLGPEVRSPLPPPLRALRNFPFPMMQSTACQGRF